MCVDMTIPWARGIVLSVFLWANYELTDRRLYLGFTRPPPRSSRRYGRYVCYHAAPRRFLQAAYLTA